MRWQTPPSASPPRPPAPELASRWSPGWKGHYRALLAVSALAALGGLLYAATHREPGAIVPARLPAGQGTEISSGSISVPVVGNPAPDFTLPGLDGRPVRLSSLRGKPVMLNFWATWCPPCRQEMPEIQRFYQRHGGSIHVLGVDVGESAEKVRRFLDEAGYSWTFVLDSAGAVAEAYMVFGIPTTYFLDRDGIIRARHIGPMTRQQLSQYAALVGVVDEGP